MIEITGIGFVNKGAELMLNTVVEEMKIRGLQKELVVSTKVGTYDQVSVLGLKQKFWFNKFGKYSEQIGKSIPKSVRKKYGIVLSKEINYIFDASGFAFGDQWGLSRTQKTFEQYSKWKNEGKKIILLPQAFGPFEKPEIKELFNKIISIVEVAYARDNQSYQYALDNIAEDNKRKIKLSPDITIKYKPVVSIEESFYKNRSLIIPNYRMIDKTNANASEYISYLSKIYTKLLEKNLKPTFLIHEGEDDLEIAQKVLENISRTNDSIIQEPNPAAIKRIIGLSNLVIGSRFHGLVSALSQNVPAIALGWSHKYEELFNDFNLSKFVTDLNNANHTFELLDDLLSNYDNISCELKKVNDELHTKVLKMWDDIEYEITK